MPSECGSLHCAIIALNMSVHIVVPPSICFLIHQKYLAIHDDGSKLWQWDDCWMVGWLFEKIKDPKWADCFVSWALIINLGRTAQSDKDTVRHWTVWTAVMIRFCFEVNITVSLKRSGSKTVFTSRCRSICFGNGLTHHLHTGMSVTERWVELTTHDICAYCTFLLLWCLCYARNLLLPIILFPHKNICSFVFLPSIFQ